MWGMIRYCRLNVAVAPREGRVSRNVIQLCVGILPFFRFLQTLKCLLFRTRGASAKRLSSRSVYAPCMISPQLQSVCVFPNLHHLESLSMNFIGFQHD